MWSGVGLIVANMIGAGVLLSAGFMAQSMSAGPILWAWVFGAGMALCGTVAYGAISRISGESGGEYRYLSDYLHPFLGYLAGWGSLLLGFSAPIAIDAIAVGAYANTLVDGPDPVWLGTAVIIGLTVAHSIGFRSSKWTQNLLVAVKITLVMGFVALGLAAGSNTWPTWEPPDGGPGFPWEQFFLNQYWIAFAFSGWNAAIYAAGEFKNPKRDVPRAMLIGCGAVGALYLVVNWVFVTNLTPELATVVFSHDETKITLGHAVMENLLGPAGGTFMSVFTLIAFFSAMSAMMLVGPRVYAAMADDGYLPAAFRSRDGAPPMGSIVLQGVVALVLLHTHTILQAVSSASTVLMIFTGLTVLSLFAMRFRRPDLPDPPNYALAAAAIYMLLVGWILYNGFTVFGHLQPTVGAVVVIAGIAYAVTRKRQG